MILDISRTWQKDRYSCGSRSLFCIAKYFEVVNSWWEVKTLTKELVVDITKGINGNEMKGLIHTVGLKYKTIKNVTLRKIKNSIEWEIPIICTVDDESHWLVIKGIDEEYVYINDPALITPQVYYKDLFFETLDAEEAYSISY